MKKQNPSMPSEPAKSKKIEDYELDSMADTVMRAAEIKKGPHWPVIQKRLHKKVRAIHSIADLKSLRAEEPDDAVKL